MNCKKQIVTIMTLVFLLLLMMSTTIFAASVGRVYNLNATMNGDQIKLTWTSVAGAAGYNVYVNDIRIGSVSRNEAALIGFSNNTTYRFKVAAYDSQKREGTMSAEKRFTTTTNQTLSQVKNVTVTQVNGYVTLNWSSVSNASRYQIFVDVPNFGELNIGEVTTTNAILKGFEDGYRYGFSIRACRTSSTGTINYGVKSTMKYCTIDYDKDDTDYNTGTEVNYTPAQVKNVSVTNITENSAYVTWSSVSNATGYKIYVSKNGGAFTYWGSTTARNYTLNNLVSDTNYRVKIAAYRNVNGTTYTGSYSTVKSFRTDEDNKVDTVTHLNVTVKNRNEAYLSWWPVDNATGYEVYISKSGSPYERITWTTDTTTILTSEMLDYATSYNVKVRAYKNVYYSNGNYYSIRGNFSSVKYFRTQQYNITQDSPYVSKVTGVTEYVKGTTVYLNWNRVSGADGYEIDFSVPGIGNVTLYADTNSREVGGVTGKDYDYTARIRAYKYINGVKQYGLYSDIVKFREN